MGLQFNRIFYDHKRSKIHLWSTIDDVRTHETFDYAHRYYVPDPSGESPWKNLSGESVKAQYAENAYSLRSLIDSCYPNIYEADIPPAINFLHDHFEGQKLDVDMDNINICYLDIETAAEDEFTKPDEAKYPINLITCHFSKSGRTVTWGLYEYNGNSSSVKEYRWFPNEAKMLDDFITIFRKENVDIITGWNSIEFDIPYIINRCTNLNVEKTLSPVNDIYKDKYGEFTIGGIAHLDYIRLYRDKFEFDTKESYSLQWVGTYELGEGKLEYEGTISDQWKNNWDEHVEYNIQDVMLLIKLEKKKKYIELSVRIGFDSLIPFDKVFTSIGIHTGYIMNFLHSKNTVMPCRNPNIVEKSIPGGYVYAEPGLWHYMCTVDVLSLYPHLIMMYNVGPDTLLLNCEDFNDNVQRTPLTDHKIWETADGPAKWGGISYDKSKKSVISTIVENIINERKIYKKKMTLCNIKNPSELSLNDKKLYEEIIKENGNKDYYDKMQHIRKIMANSLYGCLANKYFNFYDPNNAACITLSGQHFIKFAGERINEYFVKKYNSTENVVKIQDTDSVMFSLDEMLKSRNIVFKNDEEACNWIDNFLNTEIIPYIKKFTTVYSKAFDAPNIINLRPEKIVKDFFISGKKQYAMNIISNDGVRYLDKPKYKVMGIATKKSDSSKYLRNIGDNILQRILIGGTEDELNEYYRSIFKEFKNIPYEELAIPGKVNEYSKFFNSDISYYLNHGVSIPSGTPYRAKAAFYYNYIIRKNKLKMMSITDGTKINLIYVKPNEYKCNAVAFIGKWPKEFNSIFEIDYDKMWAGIETKVDSWFSVVGFGKPQKIKNSFKSFFN